MTEYKYDGLRTIALKALTGSHNYNLNTVDSDKDYKYFLFPTFDDLYNNKMYSFSSQSPEIDFTCQDVRQLVSLISKGNINFIEVLFSKDFYTHKCFEWMFNEPEIFASMNLFGFYKACWGMHLEKMATLHKGTATTIPLVDKFGYDTKQACHALRCLFSISRYMKFGSMKETLWFNAGSNDFITLMKIKHGDMSEQDFIKHVEYWKDRNYNEAQSWYEKQSFNQQLFDEAQLRLKEDVYKQFI